MNQTNSKESFAKLKACILYACEKQDASNVLDSVKLNKVLWYADTAAYLQNGESITGSRYIRKPKGPVAYAPAAVKDFAAHGALTLGRRFDEASGAWLETYEVTHTGQQVEDRFGEDGEAQIMLSDRDKERLDRAFKTACVDHTSQSISEKTHGEIWNLAKDGEDIPLYAIYAERLGQITKTHIHDAAPTA